MLSHGRQLDVEVHQLELQRQDRYFRCHGLHEGRRADLEKAAADKLASAQTLSEKLAGQTLTVEQKAGVDGRLFGSVTNFDIAEGLKKLGFSIQKSQIRLPHGPLKTVGDHVVSVAPHTDVVVDITVRVAAEAE